HIANESVNIDGGDMIEVTGTGTAGDPYVVSIAEGRSEERRVGKECGDRGWATHEDIEQANERVTKLVKNKDSKYTGTNEAGATFVIDVPSSVVNQFEEIYNFNVKEEFTVITGLEFSCVLYLSHIANESVNIDGGDMIEVTGTGTAGDPYVVSIAEGVANSMLITNASGDLEWATIADIVQANETVTTLVNNNDGTYTYTNEEG